MRTIRFLLTWSILLSAGCASTSPPKPRGMFDLSSQPEPGIRTAPEPSPLAHTGLGRPDRPL